MNERPDEPLDQWVRQSLDGLSDTLPPGSTFRGERLWEQMSPQLATPAPTTRWQPKRAWWAAAACGMAVMLLGWIWQRQAMPDSVTVTLRSQPATTKTSPVHRNDRKRQTKRTDDVTARPGAPRHPALPHASVTKPATLPDDVVSVPLEPIASVNQGPTPPIESAGAQPAPPTRPTTGPKRQFRVAHINELMAEDEARPAPDRAERFVRLGTNLNALPDSDTPPPAITLSLTTKSIQ
ncbi:MAG: hypothetical protein H7Z72_10650 [Bacteroidetes bacterium]|nr:hypothetical protein [Fibrella sp.]